MIGGVTIGIAVYKIKGSGGKCQQTWENLYYSFGIYFSYFLLFCHFFYQAYLSKNNRYDKKQVKEGKKNDEEIKSLIKKFVADINSNSQTVEVLENHISQHKSTSKLRRRAARVD